MTYHLRYFWEKFKVLRGLVSPFFDLRWAVIVVKSSVEFNAVKLGGVVFEFVFCSPGVEIGQVLPVPLSAADVHVGLFYR